MGGDRLGKGQISEAFGSPGLSVCTVGCEPRIRVGDVFHVLAKGGEDVDSTGLEICEELSSAVAIGRTSSVLVPSTVSR